MADEAAEQLAADVAPAPMSAAAVAELIAFHNERVREAGRARHAAAVQQIDADIEAEFP
jgi:hypothetical protein